MKLIDTHCHFDEPDFTDDRSLLVDKMHERGVTDLIFPATSAKHWPRLRDICSESPHFHATYGLHPVYLAEHTPEDIVALRHWLEQEQPVAVGECGLDFFLPHLDIQTQEDLFTAHLKLAREFDLPLIIHARRSLDCVLKHIRRFSGENNLKGVIHSFAGSQQQANQLIERGFYLGVGGTSTYPRAQRLRTILANVPLEALLLETDAPDQPDSAWRGKRNDPTRLPVIAATLAELRGESLARIAEVTTANAVQLFKL
ncbi:TatD family hydrolase [Thiothrix litoralis]|jgi:TatD DNase family protein|uniref:TatD family hydrolase n=1 Tax=Thiothrix litoralis TaxID=2891210 RepID=A0ABX7WPV5_9GAMM|nr:TatD family hydrolase [Thiothrix litoralis]QTR45216.1 TatD family hydrolase [Thiothrix litoralis]